ncbi:MAG: ArsR family transcriptional regulator [Actinobacteria bacterium]|nr:ArsR family transcriptional regulator [Actinomycetota bacterium]
MGFVMEFRGQTPPLQQSRSSADELSRVAELFGLVADRTRAAILYALSDSKELTASQLITAVEASEDAVIGCLRVLRGARMVHSRRYRGAVLYSLADGDLADLLQMAALRSQEVPVEPVGRRSMSSSPAGG